MNLLAKIKQVVSPTEKRTLEALEAQSDPTIVKISNDFRQLLKPFRDEFPEAMLDQMPKEMVLAHLQRALEAPERSWSKLIEVKKVNVEGTSSQNTLKVTFAPLSKLTSLDATGTNVLVELEKLKEVSHQLRSEWVNVATKSDKSDDAKGSEHRFYHVISNLLSQLNEGAKTQSVKLRMAQSMAEATRQSWADKFV